MNLKKIGKLFTSKFFGTWPSSYKKRIYRAAVSQKLRNTCLTDVRSASLQKKKNKVQRFLLTAVYLMCAPLVLWQMFWLFSNPLLVLWGMMWITVVRFSRMGTSKFWRHNFDPVDEVMYHFTITLCLAGGGADEEAHDGAVGWSTGSWKVAGSIPDGVSGIFRWSFSLILPAALCPWCRLSR